MEMSKSPLVSTHVSTGSVWVPVLSNFSLNPNPDPKPIRLLEAHGTS